MKKHTTILKEQQQLLAEFEKYKKMKSKHLTFKSLASTLQERKSLRDVKLLKIIMVYLETKSLGMPINIRYCTQVLARKQTPDDVVFNISKSTFQREVAFFQKYKHLKPHSNGQKRPANKIDDGDRERLINEFDKMSQRSYQFHGQTVPMSMAVLYYFVTKEYKRQKRVIPIKYRTFARWVSGESRYFISKYTNKRRRRILRKLSQLKQKLIELEQLLLKTKQESRTTKMANTTKNDLHVIANNESGQRKQSPLRDFGKPGMIVQWDGSEEKFYKKTKIYRMHAIDQKTLYNMGIAFVKHESNRGYLKLLQSILQHGKPKLIKCDRRVGVDPAHEMALIANLCRLLGITIMAQSNATHKADIERINGPAHTLFNGIAIFDNLKTLQLVTAREADIRDEFNHYFNKAKPDFSHLEKVSEREWQMLNAQKHVVIKLKSLVGLVYEKKVYRPCDEKGNWVELSRFETGVLCIEENAKWIWLRKGIFRLREIKASLQTADLVAFSKSNEMVAKHFANNGVIILNEETYHLLYKQAREDGKQIAIRHKLFEINKQYQTVLKKKKRLLTTIESL